MWLAEPEREYVGEPELTDDELDDDWWAAMFAALEDEELGWQS